MSWGAILGLAAAFVVVTAFAGVLVAAWAVRDTEARRRAYWDEGVEIDGGQVHDV